LRNSGAAVAILAQLSQFWLWLGNWV
jgi:hypothetical protein